MATMNTGLGGPAGYGENVFSTTTKDAGSNDDGSVFVDISSVFGSGLDFFGTNYTGLYVNSNGNISFGSAFTDYQTADLSAETTPLIAPFFGDVNINNGGEIYWDLDPTAGTVTITWDGVAPYTGTGNNSFQIVLTDTGSGDFTVEFIYETIEWTTGYSQVAEAGITDGGANDYELAGSGDATAMADYENADFGTGDLAGTTDFTFSGGTPVTPGPVEGTGGADVIDGSYAGDPEGDVVDGGDGTGAAGNEDIIYGYGGNDTISAGDENDAVYGGDGADSIDGGSGDDLLYGEADTDTIDGGHGADTIYGGSGTDVIDGGSGADTIYGDSGDAGLTPSDETLTWTDEGGNNTNLGTGFTQTTGTMDVTVTMTSTGNNNPTLLVRTETQYVDTGEDFGTNSSGRLYGQGDGDTADVTIDFAAATGSGMLDDVTNVAFRINDVDMVLGNHLDTFDIIAYDSDGNTVPVTLTAAGADVVTGQSVTASNSSDQPADAEGSVLVEIAGPVAQIVLSYSNDDTNTQAIFFTDITFTTIPDALTGDADTITGGTGDDVIYGEGGDDVIDGEAGADTIEGGGGDDTITLGADDVATGGDGDDVFILDPTDALGGPGATITIVGSETDEDGIGDSLHFNYLISPGDITYTTPESGSATLSDGTIVTFSDIENVFICFTGGARIATPFGERRIEELARGDLVLTRDHGPQPLRWIGSSTIPGTGLAAPIRFARGTFGADRPFYVSPQHRMLYVGGNATLHFHTTEVMVPAKHLINGGSIRQVDRASVRYFHLLFDGHEVIRADQVWSESFHPGAEGLATLDTQSREDLFGVFPELRADPNTYGSTARTVLRGWEARVLTAA